MSQKVIIKNLGTISYEGGLEAQKKLAAELLTIKQKNKNLAEKDRLIPDHYFVFCEHNPVFTLGRTGSEKHLLVNSDELKRENISYFKTNRGGDITFHGPGQLVGYPIFDLEYFFRDVHKFIRFVEEGIIKLLGDYGLEGIRIKDHTGVWMASKKKSERKKICAIGVHLSRWISTHGFALNVNTELSYFSKIIPCGISTPDMTVTSMEKELGEKVDVEEVRQKLLLHYSQIFDFDFSLESEVTG